MSLVNRWLPRGRGEFEQQAGENADNDDVEHILLQEETKTRHGKAKPTPKAPT